MKTIRVILSGRAGNNLFQYAAGRALAARSGVPLVLDSSLIDGSSWKVSAHILSLPLQAAHRRDQTPIQRWIHRVSGRLPAEFAGRTIFREPPEDHAFRPEVLDLPGGSILFGFFQSPEYFRGIEDALREELEPSRWVMPEPLVAAGRRIGQPGGIAVHCRRGDYVNNPNVDLLGPAYFQQAMEEMRARIPGSRFHLFSDEPRWCRETFAGSDVLVEDHAGADANPLFDWYLMSQASHHILSNSTYAWWGAWFGRKPGQTVLVPPVWFEGIHAPVREKCLPHWEIFTPPHGLR